MTQITLESWHIFVQHIVEWFTWFIASYNFPLPLLATLSPVPLELDMSSSSEMPKIYYCNCWKYCKQQKVVSKRTFYNHRIYHPPPRSSTSLAATLLKTGKEMLGTSGNRSNTKRQCLNVSTGDVPDTELGQVSFLQHIVATSTGQSVFD
jgi:hypothetical protein